MQNDKGGSLLILVGAAGAGKNSLTRLLEERLGFRMFPSYSTRAMRPGERPDYPYRFVTTAEFERMSRAGRLRYEVTVAGNRYGLDTVALQAALERGEQLVLHMTQPDAAGLRQRLDRSALVLVRAGSEAEQRRRLRARGASDEAIGQRLADANVQHPSVEAVDLVLVNEAGQLEEALERLVGFLEAKT
jgi:guanylate kinase